MCNSWTIRVVEDNNFCLIFSVIYLVYVIVCMFLALLLQQIGIRAKNKKIVMGCTHPRLYKLIGLWHE